MKSTTRTRYRYYERAVQSPHAILDLLTREFKKLHGKKPLSLREDFCGSGWLAAEWVQRGPKNSASAIDLSSEALAYGQERHFSRLSRSQQKRLLYLQRDVRTLSKERFDVVVALNFSYCTFQDRKELLAYFIQVRKSLSPSGLFVLDLFGGSRAQDLRTRKIRHSGFEYQWECCSFNPVNNRGSYAIHFKPTRGPIVTNAFTYDWRLWGCAELRDILKDAGFSDAIPYWEGDGPNGRGDGNFLPTEWEENSKVWQSFLVSMR